MSGVVIRCPNCGTIQTALGECDACHEAQARYFCTNHEPGRWLDAPACPACGARFGRSGATAAPPRATPPATRAPLPPRVQREPREPRELDVPDREPEIFSGPVHSPRDRAELDPGFSLDPSIVATAAKVVNVVGCLRRIVILAVILFILGVLAFFGLFGVGGLLWSGSARATAPVYATVDFAPRSSQ